MIHTGSWTGVCQVISFGDICVPAGPCSCGHTITNPPPHTLPYYPVTKHPQCPVSQARTLGWGLPPPIMDVRQQNLRLARSSADSVCPRAHRYLHHGLQDLTPGLAPPQHSCMHPHFTPTSPPPTPLQIVAISIFAVNCLSSTCHRASSLQLLRTELTSPETPNPHTPWLSIQKSLGCTPLMLHAYVQEE